jgi:poly-gamma-glutamate capsule biosynthesis protein CapA/YwtB (metallophosphatase superfamily)
LASTRLSMLGDVMLGRLVNEALKERVAEFPWGDTLPLLEGTDFRMCNLECAISDDGEPWPAKEFHFRSDTRNVSVLLAGKVDVVSLANNHALDYGYSALVDTLETLDGAGIAHVGAGRTLSEAEAPAIVERNGVRISIVGFTDNEPDWEARPDGSGVFYVPVDLRDRRSGRLLEIIEESKKKADLVVVSAHWGSNWGYTPPQEHIAFAHALVDGGADIIFGHSAHVFRGIEIYRGRPVIYSAGDFIDDYAVDSIERNDESFVFLVEASRSRIQGLRLYPTTIAFCQANRATGSIGRAIGEKMGRLCAGFNTPTEWRSPGHLELRIGPKLKGE